MAQRWGWRVVARATVMLAAAAMPAAPHTQVASAASMIDRTGRFAIQWWTADDGVPDGPLRGIAFAADGSIFCTSNRQIVRFDGSTFQPVPAALVDRLHATIGDFWSITVDGAGRLWVRGTRGVVRLDGLDEHTDIAPLSLPSGHITGMSVLADGRAIFIGEGVVLGCEGDAVVPLSTTCDDPMWRYGGVDPTSGSLWLWGDVDGVRRLYHGRLPRRPSDPIIVEEVGDAVASRVISLGFGPSGPMALLPDAVAVHRDDHWERLPPTLPDADFRGSGKVLEASDGTVWISSHNGLLACRAGDIETAIEGLPGFSSFTYQLAVDREGGVWAACTGGLLAVRRTSLQVRSLADCRAMHERADGSLLVGTPGAVMLVPTGSGADAAPRRIATLPKDAIPTALCEDDSGRIWVGTQDSFLLRIDDGRVAQLTKPDHHYRELRSIEGVARDAVGRIWIGTGNGLAVHDSASDTMRIVSAHDEPFQSVVVGIAPDTDGGMLAATLGSGIEHHGPDGRVTRVLGPADLPGRKAVVMLRDSDGTLWVGGDRGLVRVARQGMVTRISTASGLAADAVRQIEEDGHGRLWIALRDGYLQGMRRADLADLAAGRLSIVRGIVCGPLDGIGDNECVGRATRAAGGSTFAIPLSHGFVRFDPTTTHGGAVPAPPRVSRRGPPGYAFHFASPGIHWAEPPLYQTRLVGVDPGWSAPTKASRRDYASLPAGTHRFEVRVVAGETNRDFPSQAIDVEVPVPWYRTGWALAGLSLLVGGLAAFVSREVTRVRSRRRIATLERQDEMARERARIARDIHDSIGAGLTRMALMSDLARQTNGAPDAVRDRLDTIYRNARGLARSVDEIVWAVNPRNDTVARFISYVVNDVEEFVRAGDLTLRLEAPDEVPENLPLSTQARHHVCLAIREILQNVLRHARATHVDFTIRVDGRELTAVVRDDGVGFDQDQALAAEQDGLQNIRSRMAEVDGSIVVESRPAAGTRVTLSVPLSAGPAADFVSGIGSTGQVNHAT